jgi:hypothetical protein
MLAGIRQIAYGLAIVVTGFLVIALANSIWAARFRADALIMFGIERPSCVFDCESPWWLTAYPLDLYEASIGVGVVMWLIGYTIRRMAKSMSSGRPA